ncbi:MAG: methyltransferase domain-containing protein [Nitrospirota bacterium]
MSVTISSHDGYYLARGAGDVERLRLLNRAYGPESEALLRRAGLAAGLRVMEVGCGSGNMIRWLAEQAGPSGLLVGLDISVEQIEQARRQVEASGLTNVSFLAADVAAPALAEAGFDLVYCRLVLIHLTKPAEALRAMAALLKPGGRLVCEEIDSSRWRCEPPSRLVARSAELKLALSDRRGQHWRIGSDLAKLVREIGFRQVTASEHMPLVRKGEEKRLLGISFLDLAPELLKEGLTTREEVAEVAAEMERVAADDRVLLGLPAMGQVWAVK